MMHAVFDAFLCHVAESESPDYLRAALQLRSLSKNARDWLNLEERYKMIILRYGWWCETIALPVLNKHDWLHDYWSDSGDHVKTIKKDGFSEFDHCWWYFTDFSMLEIPGVNNVVFEDELYHNGDVPILVDKLCRYSHHVKYARFELSEGLGDDILRKCGRTPINIAGALEHLAKGRYKGYLYR